MDKIPKLKKRIRSFLTKEDGKINKESLVKVGALLGAAAIASLNSVDAQTTTSHTNSLELKHEGEFESAKTIATHSHSSHASHSSHGSHGSHSSTW